MKLFLHCTSSVICTTVSLDSYPSYDFMDTTVGILNVGINPGMFGLKYLWCQLQKMFNETKLSLESFQSHNSINFMMIGYIRDNFPGNTWMFCRSFLFQTVDKLHVRDLQM